MLCATNNFLEIAEKELDYFLVSNGQALPRAQLTDELQGFCSGRSYHQNQDFRLLDPIIYCLWELKTPDIRIYGWFVTKDLFVAHTLADANTTHRENYARTAQKFVKATKDYRDDFLKTKKFIKGIKTNDVVSNRIE